ncbi:MAG: heavy metal translocating P-type ATPase [Anaeromicrobium sp.]|jgi:Cd2+/Zn2+-exporting ATPase|uniref:heavy metal translocating P-type ATPase n=1 Tax=Anaeromicrobium sp. TaxID=1929132 RepID=UPI0025ECB27C|nr:heavy metal translocating P-type ATPase [Anaeromicrobium sp.]MCT4594408.1 heavy metal translocating P-type ATPase [Anaeromicrobium sp.]
MNEKHTHNHGCCCCCDYGEHKNHEEHIDREPCNSKTNCQEDEDGSHHHEEGDCCGHHHNDHLKNEINNTMKETATSMGKDYMIKEFLVKGLHCGSCAAKIEDKAGKLSDVNRVIMNFATSTLTIEGSKKHMDSIINEVKTIVNQVEPGTIVTEKSHTSKNEIKEEPTNKSRLYRMGMGILVFLGALYFRDESFSVLLFAMSYFAIGKDIILKSLRNILGGQLFDENFLMTIATVAAFAIGEYPEAVMVVLLYEIGEHFQEKAVESSRKSIVDLMDIRPDYANLQEEHDLKRVSPYHVNRGDIIVVKPGEKVPLDGEIIEGSSSVDTSALTGESALRDVTKGDAIVSGFINIDGVLTIKVSKNFKESAVSKILDLVENASGKKAKTEKRITKFARYYTPVVVLAAIITALLPPLLMEGESFHLWIYKAAIFLVISCPCALVISVPMGYFAGLGASSKNGILVKGGNYLEALTEIDRVVFDKTGTLTKGNFKVDKIVGANGISKDELLKYTSYVESFSNHPIALSIIKEYEGTIDKKLVKEYKDVTGKGVMALVDGVKVASGNKRLMDQLKIECDSVDEVGTIVYTAIDGKYGGHILIKDEVKKDSKDAIRKLKENNIKEVVMLTGDKKEVADLVGKELNIDRVYSELLPQNKVEKVEELYDENIKGLAFVGDGINDAPVLARANVGIAMGGVGSDAAIEAADVVIMNDEPSKLAVAIEIAKKTKKIVNMNIGMSVGIKLLVFILTFMNLGTMWLAIFADVGVATLAVMNSMRILKE